MKKILFLLVLTMTCQKVYDGGTLGYDYYRCENDEVICYTTNQNYGRPLTCKFKADFVKNSQNQR